MPEQQQVKLAYLSSKEVENVRRPSTSSWIKYTFILELLRNYSNGTATFGGFCWRREYQAGSLEPSRAQLFKTGPIKVYCRPEPLSLPFLSISLLSLYPALQV